MVAFRLSTMSSNGHFVAQTQPDSMWVGKLTYCLWGRPVTNNRTNTEIIGLMPCILISLSNMLLGHSTWFQSGSAIRMGPSFLDAKLFNNAPLLALFLP